MGEYSMNADPELTRFNAAATDRANRGQLVCLQI